MIVMPANILKPLWLLQSRKIAPCLNLFCDHLLFVSQSPSHCWIEDLWVRDLWAKLTLAHSSSLCLTLAFWRFLAHSCSLWRALYLSNSLWLILAHSVSLWLTLAFSKRPCNVLAAAYQALGWCWGWKCFPKNDVDDENVYYKWVCV